MIKLDQPVGKYYLRFESFPMGDMQQVIEGKAVVEYIASPMTDRQIISLIVDILGGRDVFQQHEFKLYGRSGSLDSQKRLSSRRRISSLSSLTPPFCFNPPSASRSHKTSHYQPNRHHHLGTQPLRLLWIQSPCSIRELVRRVECRDDHTFCV